MKNLIKSNEEHSTQEDVASQIIKDDSTKCNSDDTIVALPNA
jgi:hypothetical protein